MPFFPKAAKMLAIATVKKSIKEPVILKR